MTFSIASLVALSRPKSRPQAPKMLRQVLTITAKIDEKVSAAEKVVPYETISIYNGLSTSEHLIPM